MVKDTVRRIVLVGVSFALLASASLASVSDVERSPSETGPSSAGAFNRWLFSVHPHNTGVKARAYARFQTYLESKGVAGIVPTWQLWRVDAYYARRCETEFFAIPPTESWSEIVPVLQLIRDEVIPEVGPVEVVSGYRTPAINACVNGAARSKHLSFSALDLVALEMTQRQRLFRQLCELQSRVGQRRAMGLGAYFDPDDLERGRRGRFHIDASGFRTWGFDYTGRSNPCPRLTAE